MEFVDAFYATAFVSCGAIWLIPKQWKLLFCPGDSVRSKFEKETDNSAMGRGFYTIAHTATLMTVVGRGFYTIPHTVTLIAQLWGHHLKNTVCSFDTCWCVSCLSCFWHTKMCSEFQVCAESIGHECKK